MTTPYGAGPAQERNRAAVEQLERQAAVTVGRAIAQMLAEVLAALRDQNGAQAGPNADTLAAAARRTWPAALDLVLGWAREVFARLLSRVRENLPDDLADDLADELPDDEALDDLVVDQDDDDSDGAPNLPPDTIAQRVDSLMAEMRQRLADVPDLVAERVTTSLREGYAAGESPEELRERVAEVLDEDPWEPEVTRIARTTTTSVYNAAHSAAADALEAQLGEPVPRMWLATQDTRTRPTHREANGQIVQSGETFQVGEARLRFPGDPLGPPAEVIQCRCVVVPVVNDLVIDLAHRVSGREAAVLEEFGDGQPLAAGLVAATRMPPELLVYWTRGEGGDEIDWGRDGDFTRCERSRLRQYVRPDQIKGLCANLHKLMTGKWPSEKAAAAAEGDADMPCPCENATEEEIRAAAALAATVIGDPDLPLAARDHEWSGDDAADRVRAWATTDDTLDVDRYSRAFFYRDPDGDPATETAYKLGFADVVDGELTAVPAGIFAVAAVLQGGRGGVDIPAADADRIRARVAGYYSRMAEAWDDPDVVAPWDTDDSGEDQEDTEENAKAARAVRAATLEEARTMAMIALVPSEQDAARLAVEGDAALPADELHVTLAFLGPGEEWVGTEQGERVIRLAERIAQDIGPITARIWARAVTGEDSETGATPFYVIGDDTGRLAELQGGVLMAAGDLFPPQHSPFVAHISTRYGSPELAGMDAVGSEVVLDRIRVEFASEVNDFPLAGDDTLDLDDAEDDPVAEPVEPEEMTENAAAAVCKCPAQACGCHSAATAAQVAVTAAPAVRLANLAAASDAAAVVAEAVANAPEQPPGAWFVPVKVDGPTPPTVTAQGRVWGHIGEAEVCHVGIKDECVTIPPTRTGYGAFHRDTVVTAEGDTVQVGYLYTGCDHSDLDMTIDEARDYLDASCTRTAAGRVYDTEFGPMFVGAVVPGAKPDSVAALWKLSGEWFTAPLELHAAVGVTEAGFPVSGTGDEIRVSDVDPEEAEQIAAGKEPPGGRAAEVVAAHRRRAALRTAEPAVIAARRSRAARLVAAYERRGA